MTRFQLLALTGALLALSTPEGVAAQQIAGKTKLGLSTNALSFASYDPGGTGNTATTSLRVGPFAPDPYGLLVVGVPPVGVDVGFGATEDVFFGTLIRLGMATLDSTGGGDGQSVYAFGLAPHLDYVLARGHAFRPFVGAIGGLSVTAPSRGDAAVFASVGFEAGGYGFVGESLTLSPTLAVTYSPGLSGGLEEFSVLAVQLQFEIAGWL